MDAVKLIFKWPLPSADALIFAVVALVAVLNVMLCPACSWLSSRRAAKRCPGWAWPRSARAARGAAISVQTFLHFACSSFAFR